jgi:hypothetical protein
MRPSSADTSEPACVKRKMLSMNSSTSWPFLVAEILGHGQAGETHAQARAGRLGHLAVDQGALGFRPVVDVDDARFLHLEPQVVAFAGALAHAGEHRHAAVLLAMLLMSSMMMTVLPTPAPPNRPILPPRR